MKVLPVAFFAFSRLIYLKYTAAEFPKGVYSKSGIALAPILREAKC